MKLGEKTPYQYEKPTSDIIDCFLSPSSKTRYSVNHQTEEFTSLCPVTGQPDFGTISITYTPDKLCIESKSLKLYLGSFRMYRGFMEQMTNKILDDLVSACKPVNMVVEGVWEPRGGIATEVIAMYPKFGADNG